MNVTLFDIHLYYGAGVQTLKSPLVYLSVLLTLVVMGVVDVTHMYLVCHASSSFRCFSPVVMGWWG